MRLASRQIPVRERYSPPYFLRNFFSLHDLGQIPAWDDLVCLPKFLIF